MNNKAAHSLTKRLLENGTLRSKIVGIITPRDVQFHDNLDDPVSAVMSTDLVTARLGVDLK